MARKSGGSAADLSQAQEIDMTPMIDVTFLLIIFFLIVTELSDASKEKLKLPLAERAFEDMHEHGRLIINVTKAGDVMINREKYEVPELRGVLEKERVLSWNPTENAPGRAILIRVDRETKFIKVYGVMLECMKQQLWKLAFATKGIGGE